MKKALAILMVAALIISCRKEKTYWDADIVAPVATSSLNLGNLFPDTLLETDNNGNLQIAIATDLFSFKADTLLKLPDTTFYNSYSPVLFPFGYIPYGPGTTFNFVPNNEVTFDIANGIKLKEATIHSGKLRLEIKNQLKQPTIFNCSVSSATLNSAPLSITIAVPAGSQTSPAYRDTFVDVSNYHVNFTGNSGTKSNTIVESMTIQIDPSASPDSMRFHDSIIANITFVDLIPEFGRGYFGNQTINFGPDSTAFDAFSQIAGGTLALDSANIQLQIKNEFGIDLRNNISSLISMNPQNGNVSLSGPGIGSSFNVGRATQTGIPSSPVNPYYKTLTYTNLNSNITQFIGNLPHMLSYQLDAQLNPLGNISGYNDFVFFGTSLSAHLDAKVPLKSGANNVTLRDTTDFNVTALEKELNNVNEGKLKLKAVNSYPFNLSIVGVLLDENNAPIETVLQGPDNIIYSPAVDVNGVSIGSRETWIEIPFDKGTISSMLKAKKIAYYIVFNTTNQPGTVTFMNSNQLDLLLTVDFNYSVNK